MYTVFFIKGFVSLSITRLKNNNNTTDNKFISW